MKPSIRIGRKLGFWAGFGLLLCLLGHSVQAGPTVVPTAEGQIGQAPGVNDAITGVRFESMRGQAGDLVFGGILSPNALVVPEFRFVTDRMHDLEANPIQVGASLNLFSQTFKQSPNSARSRNATDDGDFVAFSFAVDGSMPQTMTVRIATYDEDGNSLTRMPVATNIPTFSDPAFNDTGVAVDNQGRVTVAYSEFDFVSLPRVNIQRFDSSNGQPLGAPVTIDDGLEDPTTIFTDGFESGDTTSWSSTQD